MVDWPVGRDFVELVSVLCFVCFDTDQTPSVLPVKEKLALLCEEQAEEFAGCRALVVFAVDWLFDKTKFVQVPFVAARAIPYCHDLII